jgi:hypothetical protein
MRVPQWAARYPTGTASDSMAITLEPSGVSREWELFEASIFSGALSVRTVQYGDIDSR